MRVVHECVYPIHFFTLIWWSFRLPKTCITVSSYHWWVLYVNVYYHSISIHVFTLVWWSFKLLLTCIAVTWILVGRSHWTCLSVLITTWILGHISWTCFALGEILFYMRPSYLYLFMFHQVLSSDIHSPSHIPPPVVFQYCVWLTYFDTITFYMTLSCQDSIVSLQVCRNTDTNMAVRTTFQWFPLLSQCSVARMSSALP